MAKINPSFRDDEVEKSLALSVDNSLTQNAPTGSVDEAEQAKHDGRSEDMLFLVDDVPPPYICVLMGFQHYITMVGGAVGVPFVLLNMLCIEDTDPARAEVLSTLIFMAGVGTLIQSTFGSRLPIVQGPTFTLLLPSMTILQANFDPCDTIPYNNLTYAEKTEEWRMRMRLIQGGVIGAGIVELLLGVTGCIGFLLPYLSPLAIAPAITLTGLALVKVGAAKAGMHWGVAFLTIALIALFSQYLKDVSLPFPYRRNGKVLFTKIRVFELFPVLLSVILSWLLCSILTASGALSEDSNLRTDKQVDLLHRAPWFFFPYPLQWGLPVVTLAGTVGIFSGMVASILDAVGDYFACAKISGAPSPPLHAVNRGIMCEGLSSVLSGIWGSGSTPVTFSENIGALKITKAGSRRIIQTAGLLMMGFGVFGKFAGLFMIIPDPIIGGVFFVGFSVITSVGIATLENVNMNSSRNMFIFGLSVYCGLAIPEGLSGDSFPINTGSTSLDQLLQVILTSPMLVGCAIGLFLDNTVPGNPEERGLIHRKLLLDGKDIQARERTYDLPFGMNFIRRCRFLTYFPVSPTYKPWLNRSIRNCCTRKAASPSES